MSRGRDDRPKFFFLILLAAAPAPSGAPTPASLERALAGRWAGTLGYRDYQSGQLFKLGIETEIRAIPDGAATVRVTRFDEGPGREPAWITTGALYDADGSGVTLTSLRKGRPAELVHDLLRLTAYTDAEHWTIIDETRSTDDGKPADLRVTEVRDGDRLTATKEVRTDGAAAFALRNVTSLKRTPA